MKLYRRVMKRGIRIEGQWFTSRALLDLVGEVVSLDAPACRRPRELYVSTSDQQIAVQAVDGGTRCTQR